MLHKASIKPNKKFFDLDDAQKLVLNLQGLGASQAQFCFGMCKMTMVMERDKKASPGYLELDFVEFLEFIGRLAHAKFLGSELEDNVDLATKIEYVMDDLFALHDLTRSEREEDSD